MTGSFAQHRVASSVLPGIEAATHGCGVCPGSAPLPWGRVARRGKTGPLFPTSR